MNDYEAEIIPASDDHGFGIPVAVPRPGAKELISDDQLLSNRTYLHTLIDSTWGKIGGKLKKLKLPDVPGILQSWHDHRDRYIVDALLRPGESATAADLKKMRKRIEVLSSINDQMTVMQSRSSQLMGLRAIARQSQERTERKQLAEEIRSLRTALTECRRKCDDAMEERRKRQDTLDRGQAYFCQHQLVLFCRSKRCRVTPLNLATALAGLPFIQYRQSRMRLMRICKWPVDEGAGYQTFLIFRRLLRSFQSRKNVMAHAKAWIGRPDSKVTDVIKDLRENWYFVDLALSTVLTSKVPQSQRP